MNSQTFVNPSVGQMAGRAVTSMIAATTHVARSTWSWLEMFSQRRARSELLRMADSYAATRPELAAQLRAAAGRDWIGDA